jgi:hypothetical protein
MCDTYKLKFINFFQYIANNSQVTTYVKENNLSKYQAVEAYRVVRCWGSQIV